MTERLGPHRYTANISFDWSQAGRSVRLEEKRSLKAGEGGVNGDFHALLENSRDLGLEVLRVNGRVYARSRYGKFRQRLRDRGMAERERDEVQGALRDVYSLFQGRMQLTPDGSVRLSGREALKFRVSLGQAADKGESLELPDAGFAKTGLDASSGLRLDFYNRREAKALQGDVWVDAETSVVLKAKLEGKLAVPREKGASLLRLSLSSQVSDFGKNPRLKAPTDFLPDEDKPQGIADALERFGYSTRLAPDAGTVNAPDDE
jgi:hypothetical protein